jgi:predicted permease
MSTILYDISFALRSWRKARLVTLIAIVSMALGIGANTAIFTLVDQVLLRTLPVPDADELVQVSFDGRLYGNSWGDGSELSFPMYADLRDNNSVFSGVFCQFALPLHLGFNGRTERVSGEMVSGTYFPVLRVGAALGRTLTPDDDRQPGGHQVAVLSHAFWTSRFAGDPAVLGSTVRINSHPYTIVGVARAGFEGIEVGRPSQVFVPMMMKAQLTPSWDALDDRQTAWVRMHGRLAPGVSPGQAAAALQPFYRSRLELEVQDAAFANATAKSREEFLAKKITVERSPRGRSAFRSELTTPLWALMGIATGVLLIACANVANLLLARGAARRREMAVRLALGATRRRLVQQLLVESVMLALSGGVAGVALAGIGAPLVLSFFVDPDLPMPISTTPDWRILAFTFAISSVTGILFGLAPAVQATRPDVGPALKQSAGGVLGGGHARVRKALVASQVAVALLLLIGAGLFLRTLDNLFKVDVGFDTDRLISFTVNPSLNGYSEERGKQFAKSLLERLHASPGIDAAGLAAVRLLEGGQWASTMSIEGYQPKGDEDMFQSCNAVSPGYFKAMGIPLLAGRDFDLRDERIVLPEKAPPFRTVIVNERFARQYFGETSPLGRRIGFGGDPGTPTPIEIIGVVRDARYTDVRDQTQRQLFFPLLDGSDLGGFTVYARTSRGADTAFQVARAAMQQLDPELPLHGLRTLESQVNQSLSNERLVATMSGIFGTLATLLAVVGLYGVMSFTVACRTREIGIRMALGAEARKIGLMVIREVLAIAAAGIAIGVPVAWWVSRFVASQLYGVQTTDPRTIAAAVALLGIVAALAGLVPSARAARVSPTIALRDE